MSADAVTRLLRSAKNLDDDQGNFIASLRRVIDEGSWRDFTLESGFHHSFDTFAGFLAWVGVDRDEVVAVLRVRGEQALASAVLAEGIPPAAQHGGSRSTKDEAGQGDNITLSDRGSDPGYIIARLKRDDPDLAQQVINGTITPNAAAITAGFRKRYAQVRTDDPARAIAALLRHYTRDQLANALNTHQDT